MELKEMDGSEAVSIRNAYKKFGRHVVLKNLDMTVMEGTIYGLLGPSGCGKTTLLRCLVGRCQLDSGDIYVKAKWRRKVGFMPQELALYQDMTIAEAFNYFGRLFGMKWGEIEDRGSEMLKLLDLPPGCRLVGSLSGGQQRRVSFAVALLHNPELLLLDEPTVGVDPILASSIWESLIKMAHVHHKTIIITTHYIEEARQANTIGLMRRGILLAEEPPTHLMHRMNCTSLEQAFLQLCQQQQTTDANADDDSSLRSYPNCSERSPVPIRTQSGWSSQRFLAQLVKNLVWNLRNYQMLIFMLMLPIAMAFLVNETIGNERFHSVIGIASLELKNGFASCNTRDLHFNCSFTNRPLSCLYMDLLREKSFVMEEFSSVEEARAAATRGKIMAYLSFAENYTASVFQRIEDGSGTTEDILDSSTMYAWVDMSNLWLSTILRRDLIYSILKLLQDLFVNCQASVKLATIPVKFETPVFGKKDPSFLHFSIPGLMTTFCFYLPVMFTTGALISEKSIGRLERSLIAGLNLVEVVAAHAVIQFMILGIQTALMLIVTYAVYFNPLTGSVTLLIILLLMVENLGMCYAFFLSVLCDSERLAAFASTGTIVVLFTVCGTVWPVQGMHPVLQYFAWALPVQPAVESYRAISVQSRYLDHPVVYKGYLSVFIWTTIIVLSSFIIAQIKKIGK
uniref:ABC protein subfamily ABCH n=2 Tax=Laodelphax striatellus TaxID=195883 RepID=A0A158UYU0_LAOST|nr:ABC protein subfamily ABCH [Laodelphax striatellus]